MGANLKTGLRAGAKQGNGASKTRGVVKALADKAATTPLKETVAEATQKIQESIHLLGNLRAEQPPRVMIGVPCNWDTLPVAFVRSLLDLQRPAGSEVVFIARAQIATMRNDLVRYFVSRPEFTHLFMLDADMEYPPASLLVLLAAQRDIITGFACQRKPPHTPIFYLPGKNRAECKYYCDTGLPDGKPGVYQVGAVGGAGLLVKRHVYENVPYPWFSTDEKTPLKVVTDEGGIPKETGGVPVGEDVYFSIKAQEHGFQVHCHTGLWFPHFITVGVYYEAKTMTVDEDGEHPNWELRYKTLGE